MALSEWRSDVDLFVVRVFEAIAENSRTCTKGIVYETVTVEMGI